MKILGKSYFKILEVPLWCSSLRVWWCHCSGSGLILGPGNSICLGRAKKKNIFNLGIKVTFTQQTLSLQII